MQKPSATAACVGLALTATMFVQAAGPAPSARHASRRASAPAKERVSAATERALLDTYCVTCHNEKAKTAGLMLDTIDVEHLTTNAETWEKVIRKLRTGAMPPLGVKRPDDATLTGLAEWLEDGLDRAAAASPHPGRPIVHRLNRTEYTNAIRDLLALEVDGQSLLPTDNAGFGFDNIGDVLSVSPALLERYLLAAQQIARLAVGDAKFAPVVETYRVPIALLQEDRMNNDLPLGSRGGISFRHYFPSDGEYVIKIRMQRPAMSNGVRGEAQVNRVDLRLDGARLKLFTVGGKAQAQGFFDTPVEIDQGMEVRAPVKAGERLIGVSFQRSESEIEGFGPAHLPPASYGYQGGSNTAVANGRIEMAVDTVEVSGPFNEVAPEDTPSRQRIFVCRPRRPGDELACARRIVSTFARRAYRRPLTELEVKTLVGFYEAGRRDGGFEPGVQHVIERVLIAPDFLFRSESDPPGLAPGTAHRVTDLELASRLSFFLWSSIPDDELLDAAVRGQLHAAPVLAQQVKRMLADDRSRALIENFFGQWLFVRNVSQVRPDPKAYPEFDENLRAAFRTETELFLASQIGEDHSALELLTANYTFLNERLARHYGVPNIYGDRFRRVTYADDRRAGILGQGAVLTAINSYANRTSPVKRGQWLLENVLGTPPPPPPPNVPPFPENDGSAPKSVRERMEQHRKNPVCASCHARIDPLGFALENFDGIGRWRTVDANAPIDASGMLPNGSKFNGPAEFRQALLKNREAFLTTMLQKLMTYGLGRGVEYYDMPSIRKILKGAGEHDYRWSSLIMGIVTSDPFLMRSSES
jgi:hypothetical protein